MPRCPNQVKDEREPLTLKAKGDNNREDAPDVGPGNEELACEFKSRPGLPPGGQGIRALSGHP